MYMNLKRNLPNYERKVTKTHVNNCRKNAYASVDYYNIFMFIYTFNIIFYCKKCITL